MGWRTKYRYLANIGVVSWHRPTLSPCEVEHCMHVSSFTVELVNILECSYCSYMCYQAPSE